MSPISSTDGVELALHDLDGEGPPLLLAHATGLHGRCWEPVAARLQEWHCLAPDLRGHGDSTAPPDHTFEWQGFADDVLAVVDALELAPGLVAAGHSKGGAALLMAEQRRPGTFDALWVFEPVVFPARIPTDGENFMAAGARRRRTGFPSWDAAFENFASKPPFGGMPEESIWAYVRGGFSEQPDGSVLLKCHPEHEARVYEMGGQHDAFDHLHLVSCPVTVVRGRIDPGPASMAASVAAALPNGHLEAREHLGHFGPLEAPDEIASSIRAAFAGRTDKHARP